MTPEQTDTLHQRYVHYAVGWTSPAICKKDEQPWPCPWEQRRAHLAAALRVVEAAIDWRNCYGEKYDAALLEEVKGYNAWRKANGVPRTDVDAWEQQHAPAGSGTGQADAGRG